MRRALAIDEKSFGPEHPNVARDLNNLALLLKDTNRPAEAEPLMRRALAIVSDLISNGYRAWLQGTARAAANSPASGFVRRPKAPHGRSSAGEPHLYDMRSRKALRRYRNASCTVESGAATPQRSRD